MKRKEGESWAHYQEVRTVYNRQRKRRLAGVYTTGEHAGQCVYDVFRQKLEAQRVGK